MKPASAFPVAAVALAAALSATPAARAARSYDNCTGFIDSVPATISTQGTWCLRKDLSTAVATGVAIAVNTNNVTIDCNDFKLGGLGAGFGTEAIGIEASARANITVRNCSIRGFQFGVRFLGAGSGHVVEDNRFDGNRRTAAYVEGTGNVIRRNTVLDTGGTTSNGFVVGLQAAGDADIVDNLVDGLTPAVPPGGPVAGILIAFPAASVVRGNHVLNIDGGAVDAIGIDFYNGTFADVGDNHLQIGTGGGLNSYGIRCSTFMSEIVAGNRIYGFGAGLQDCQDDGNIVRFIPE
jgi:hypothetical protein